MRRFAIVASQFILAAFFWMIGYLFPTNEFHIEIHKAFLTFMALGIIYLVFRIVLQHFVNRRMKEERMRYTARRMLSVLYLAIDLGVLVYIWVENPGSVVVSFGIIGAGVAIGLQDMFRNLAGGLTIIFTGIYRVGDRIEVNGKIGDVIDIGIMYTTILELREWVDANQPTGRLSNIPNAVGIDAVINNFSKDYSYMWAELELPITYDSDWHAAREMVLQILKEVVGSHTAKAEKEMSDITSKYFLKKVAVEPAVYVTLTTNWVDLHIRYPVPVGESRQAKDRIFTRLLEEIEKRSDIHIASSTQTITIANLPNSSLHQDRER